MLWRYLRDEIGVDELTPAEVATRVTRDFLQAPADEWIARFYAFLYTDPALWRAPVEDEQPGPARTQPIIRLEDGRQVTPFDPRRPPGRLPARASRQQPAHGPASHRRRTRPPGSSWSR